MHTLDRARRSFQELVVLAGERDHRPMTTLPNTGRDQADDALVPGSVVDTHTGRPALRAHCIDVGECLLAHRGLDIPPLAIDAVELVRIVHRCIEVVGQQALDADGDILETTGRVDARTNGKTKVGADTTTRLPTRLFQDSLDTHDRMTGTNSQQSLVHEDAIVVIERHDVGDRTQRNEVEVLGGDLGGAGSALLLQHASNARHQVEGNTDAGQVATRKPAAIEVRVNDDCGVRQFLRRADDDR